MIKFFRKIRQQLLSDLPSEASAKGGNKFSKYLIYAIGEIILVMIGILLALQVSNWNQARVTKTNEIKTLKQLNVDLSSNLIEIKQLDSFIRVRSEVGEKILNHFETKDNVTDSLRLWVEQFSGGNIFNNANTTYKNLENSENIVISNDSLRIRITLMYETEFANIHLREEMFTDEYFKPYNSQLFKNFKTGPVIDKWLVKQTLSTNTPKDYNQLRKNEDYKSALVEAYNFRLLRQQWLSETLIDLKKLIKDIEQEIETLQ